MMNKAILLGGLLMPAAAAYAGEPRLILAGAHVLDPGSDAAPRRADVVIEAGQIAAVAPGAPRQPGDRAFDLPGLLVLPGLIDLHSHLLLHPYNEAPWNDQVLKESLEFRTIRAVAAARATVESGFTTLRDLGTEAAGFADVALRDAITQGLIPGPRIFAATRAIVATACYGPSGFDPRWTVPQGAQEATGSDECRRAVRQQIAAGADWIKFYADYRRSAGAPDTATFTQEEMNAMVHEAHTAGIPASAHATSNEGIRRAVLAGVDTIEHGYHANAQTLALMKERGVVLCPTLAAAEAVARYRGWQSGQPDPPSLAESKASFNLALQAGVRIACGSDVGVFAHGESWRELELMVAYGMTAQQALCAATSVAAKVLRREGRLGVLQVGAAADLIVLKDNPLQNLATLRQPLMVIKDGQVVIDRRK